MKSNTAKKYLTVVSLVLSFLAIITVASFAEKNAIAQTKANPSSQSQIENKKDKDLAANAPAKTEAKNKRQITTQILDKKCGKSSQLSTIYPFLKEKEEKIEKERKEKLAKEEAAKKAAEEKKKEEERKAAESNQNYSQSSSYNSSSSSNVNSGPVHIPIIGTYTNNRNISPDENLTHMQALVDQRGYGFYHVTDQSDTVVMLYAHNKPYGTGFLAPRYIGEKIYVGNYYCQVVGTTVENYTGYAGVEENAAARYGGDLTLTTCYNDSGSLIRIVVCKILG